VINFRFHIVSLVAVFLALAIGVVMGYGVLGQPTVEGLRNRIDTVEANADARRRENDELKALVEQLDASMDATAPFAVTDRLTDVPVLIVAIRGVDDATVKRTVDLARRGGATAPGVLWLEDKWTLDGDGDAAALATASGTPTGKKAAVRTAALDALAARLATGRTIGDDTLRALADAGFITFEGVGDSANTAIGDLGGTGTRAVLLVGTDGAVAAKLVVGAFGAGAVDAGLALTVGETFRDAEGSPGRGSLVGAIRGDESLAAQISTVDDIDQPSGDVVALLALADLGRNVVGHYGYGEGATAPAPTWWQP
jgi:hypothetical protein